MTSDIFSTLCVLTQDNLALFSELLGQVNINANDPELEAKTQRILNARNKINEQYDMLVKASQTEANTDLLDLVRETK